MLHADAVSFAYTADPVLRGVSLSVPTGGLVGLLGPNGSGKTTLLRVLAGILQPASGRVTLDGDDIAGLARRALARRMAMVPQTTHTTFDYDVLEIVMMGRYPHLRAFQVEGPADLRHAQDALAATGTTALSARGFATLSGGERQRVVIASALTQLASRGEPSGQSPILLLDEPTASLDLGYQLEIARLIRDLNERGLTIIVSTHDVNLAARLCRDLVLLRRGRIMASGPTHDVLDAPAIAQLFGVESHVSYSAAAGHRVVVPIARTSPAAEQ